MQTDDNSSPAEPPQKKHKKHKKKHKRKKECDDDAGLTSPKSSIKLKLKIGSETMGTTNFTSIVHSDNDDISEEDRSTSKLGGGHSEDELSEEEKWLNALEKGKLNSYGEIGSAKKDPAQLTARQKALLHGSQQDELLQLPSGYKTVELTDEQKQLRQDKAKRRREQAHEKIENDKNLTVSKLLKKQERSKRHGKGRGGKRANIPRVMYKDKLSGISISLPSEMSFPLAAQKMESYPEAEKCGVEGCTNKKTSVCFKSLVPVCGLECYKKNLLKWTQSQSDSLSSGPHV